MRLSKNILQFTEITLGGMLVGVALSVFLVRFKIAPGGISGVSTVIHYLTGIRVSTLILLLNAPLFILGFLIFDKGFLVKSIYGTIASSLATEVMTFMPSLTEDILLASVFGGAIMGAGLAFVLKARGSTGGTDILVLVLRRFLPKLSVGQLFLLIDGIIILIAGAFFRSFETILYSGIALFVTSRVTDVILEGLKFARLVYIISEKNEQITREIYSKMNRGVTGLNSFSMYTGKSGRILMCAIRRHEIPSLKDIVKEIDENAFVIIADAKEVMGNGFENNYI